MRHSDASLFEIFISLFQDSWVGSFQPVSVRSFQNDLLLESASATEKKRGQAQNDFFSSRKPKEKLRMHDCSNLFWYNKELISNRIREVNTWI